MNLPSPRSSPTLIAATLLLLLPCGCSGGGSRPGDLVLATATVGPQGGSIAVQDGTLEGLVLSVPPGALVSAVELRVVHPGFARTSQALLPGDPVRLEPVDQEFLVPAELELPYRTRAMVQTAPGNVRARHQSALGERQLTPRTVDVGAGRMRVDVEILGTFQVVAGPAVSTLRDYIGGDMTPVPLEDGYTYRREQPFDPPRFPGRLIEVWTVQTPSGAGGTGCFLEDLTRRGRFSIDDDWHEIWDDGVALQWNQAPPGQGPITTFARIFSPISAATATWFGTIDANWSWRFSEPMQVGDELLLDLVQLTAAIAWDRNDIGRGESVESYWFAPGIGLVAIEQDGMLRRRTDL